MPARRKKPPITSRRPDQTFRQSISKEMELVIGRAIVTWTHLEQVIEELVWHFLRITIDEGRIVTANLDAKHKMNLLRELGRRHLKDQTLVDLIETLNHTEGLYAERNLIAHGRWVTLLPDNTPAVMSLREKLPDDISRNEVIASTMSRERMFGIVNNMKIAINNLVELRRELSASQDKQLLPPSSG